MGIQGACGVCSCVWCKGELTLLFVASGGSACPERSRGEWPGSDDGEQQLEGFSCSLRGSHPPDPDGGQSGRFFCVLGDIDRIYRSALNCT